MAYSDDIFLPENRCEICGAELTDEVVIQEFADGSIARLCAECAAGAALHRDGEEFAFPDDPVADHGDVTAVTPPEAAAAIGVESPAEAPASAVPQDVLEKTRELMTPVVDLLSLQQDMQGALQRLATSLQTFATGVMTENVDKNATLESRVQALEAELESTRARLREAEARLAAGAAAATAPVAAAAQDEPPAPVAAKEPASEAAVPEVSVPEAVAPEETVSEDTAAADELPSEFPPVEFPPVEEPAAASAAAAASLWDFESTMEATAESSFVSTEEFLAEAETSILPPAKLKPPAERPAAPVEPPVEAPVEAPRVEAPPVAPLRAAAPVAPPSGPPTAEPGNRHGFQLVEVQIAQRYFNESQFTNRIRDVRKSLGKPKANLSKLVGGEPRALITITWDIIWYQYLVDLRRDIPADKRVVLHREGMDLDELPAGFREKNASIDDEGRLDASELEVKLLSDPSTLITEMSIDEEKALEDATEEIWDQKTAPEFKWDD